MLLAMPPMPLPLPLLVPTLLPMLLPTLGMSHYRGLT